MDEMGLSPGSVQSIIDSKKAVERYQHRLDYCYAYLSENNFPDKHFQQQIEPELVSILKKNGKSKKCIQKEIRETNRRWGFLALTKSQFLIRLNHLIPEELDSAKWVNTYCHDVPFGCVTKDATDKLTPEQIQRWSDGNLLMYHKNSSYINLTGVLLSENFFVIETLCRTILFGSCLEFALKSLDEKTTVQHKEIYQSLKRMGDANSDKIICKLCSFNKRCKKCADFLILAQVYELFYHLRVIKDYKMEFWDMELFSPLFSQKNLEYMFNIVIKVQQIDTRIYNGYWRSPFHLYKDNQRIDTLIQDFDRWRSSKSKRERIEPLV